MGILFSTAGTHSRVINLAVQPHVLFTPPEARSLLSLACAPIARCSADALEPIGEGGGAFSHNHARTEYMKTPVSDVMRKCSCSTIY